MKDLIINVLFLLFVSSCSEGREKAAVVMDNSKIQECSGSFSSTLSLFEIIRRLGTRRLAAFLR